MESNYEFFDVNYKKYGMIYISTAILHMMFILLMCFVVKDNIFAIYNGISAVVYTLLAIIMFNKINFRFCLITCFSEILIFSTFGTLRFGYNSGFSLYVLCIIPLTMYLLYVIKKETNVIMTYVVFEFSMFILMTFVSEIDLIPRPEISSISLKCIYGLNSIAGIIILVAFVMIFMQRTIAVEHDLRSENKRLENVANYDPLTKLLNRRTFDHYFQEAVVNVNQKGQDFTVMMVDIDDFKKVNDTYGHDAGDEVLKNVALILKCMVRPYDTVFRWGGEEIVLLLAADKDEAYVIAERCRTRIEQFLLQYDNQEIKITITSGLCSYTAMDTKDSMIEKADASLYYGKQHGKN